MDYVLALLVAAIWGGNFVAAQTALSATPPFLMLAIRFAIVALVLIPFVRLPRTQHLHALRLAITLGLLHFGLFFVGMSHADSASTAVLVSQMGVPFSCLLGVWLLQDSLGWRRITGLTIAFAGLAVMAGAPVIWDNWPGFILMLAGAFFWGIANIQIKQYQQASIMALLAWMSAYTAPMLLLCAWLFGETTTQAFRSLGHPIIITAMLYMTLGSTIIAYGLWYYLLRKHPVSHIVPFSLLVPVFGISATTSLLGDSLSTEHVLGGILTVLGVSIIILRRPRSLHTPEAA